MAPGLRRLVAGEPGAVAGIGGSRYRLFVVGEPLIDPGLAAGRIRVSSPIVGGKFSRKPGAANAGIGGSQNRLRVIIGRLVDAGGFARGIPCISCAIAGFQLLGVGALPELSSK